jgi:tetratricopeptide (TPR) repeat protein
MSGWQGITGIIPLCPQPMLDEGEPLLLKALEIDDTLAEAHAMMGAIRQDEGDWLAAEKEFKRARELNPSAWGVHSLYAKYLAAIGRNDEAVMEAKRMLEIDPLSPSAVGAIALMSLQARQYDQAIEFFRKAIDMQPNDPRFHNNLARALVQREGMKRPRRVSKGQLIPNRREDGVVGIRYGNVGKRAVEAQARSELKQQARQSIDPVNLRSSIRSSEKDRAEWLERPMRTSGPP